MLRCAGGGDEAAHRQRPVARQIRRRDERRDEAGYVDEEGDERYRESRFRRCIEPAGIDLPQIPLVLRHVHSPVPLASARSPATSITMMTSRRTTAAGVRPSILAPMREPSITPRIDGTAMSGSSAPRWI